MKIGFLDIETTNLSADVGHILCANYQLRNLDPTAKPRPMQGTRIDSSPGYRHKMYDDSKCVKDIAKWLYKDNPDWIVTWYGDYFDLPYINSKLILLNQKPLPAFRSMDHWKTARYKLKLRNAKLDTVARYLKCREVKTFYSVDVWRRAAYGSKVDLDKIVKHCEIDVRVLEACHNKLIPLLRSMRGIY